MLDLGCGRICRVMRQVPHCTHGCDWNRVASFAKIAELLMGE